MKIDLLLTPRRATEVWMEHRDNDGPRISAFSTKGIFELDHVGYELWSLLDGQHTVESIIEEIARRYPNQPRGRIQEDICGFIEDLSGCGLVKLDYWSLTRTIEAAQRGRLPMTSSLLHSEELQVLLIIPPSSSLLSNTIVSGVSTFAPLGVGYIASTLRSHGFSVSIANLAGDTVRSIALLQEYIDKCRPRIIGFSTMTETINSAIRLASFCKMIDPTVQIVMGGPHATFMAKELLDGDNPVDYVVRREGEYTMVELACYLLEHQGSPEKIRGLTYKAKGGYGRTLERTLLRDLHSLPYPARDIVSINQTKRIDSIAISSSRGCPAKCTFCSAGAMSGGIYRVRTPRSMVSEIEQLKLRGHKKFSFVDDTITPDTKRLMELCQLLQPLSVVWNAESRVDVLARDKNIAIEMAHAGCEAVQLGVESGSDDVLRSIRKGVTVKQIEEAVKNATEAGLLVACSMMIGLPADTIESIQATIDFAEKLQKKWGAVAILAICTPYPGTYIFQKATECGVRIVSRNFDDYILVNPVMETEHFSIHDLRKLHFQGVLRLSKSIPDRWKARLTKRFEGALKVDANPP